MFEPNHLDESVDSNGSTQLDNIAIIGMALRVPGAKTLEQFWVNLKDGVESTTFFTDQMLIEAGVDPAVLNDPLFVKAFARLEGADQFDASFFDLTPHEAEVLDPQHRQLLECGWEALEHAGYGPGSISFKVAGRIGFFAGVGLNSYLLNNLMGRQDLLETLGGWQITLGNDKDFAVTRVAYKLDLRGPVANVSTACSTSLVAVVMGCQSLLSYQSDMILAGGCSIHLPQDHGYWHHPGGTLSPDGCCRAFDAQAQGTLDGNGVAMVMLKRLEDAIADGDTIHAVIRGFAVNNDGANKVGYTAPSVAGQSMVIREAREMARVAASSIGYVETHGTGTDLGDLVEITALTEAFRDAGVTTFQQCAIGSLKTNVGHLDTAAGVASLIKTVLSLKHGKIPPSLHFTRPNPKLELEQSPFYVNARVTSDWPRLPGIPRRAAVSSFGIGGTNAHVIVEEAPVRGLSRSVRPWQLLPVSARGERSLQGNCERLATYLVSSGDAPVVDVAYTLQTGRCAFPYRTAILTRTTREAAVALTDSTSTRILHGRVLDHAPTVVFLLPGQESQYPGMARELLRDEPIFQQAVERCAEILRRRHHIDLVARMRNHESIEYATDPIPLFVVEYALAQFWLALGVKPRALLGSSLGEYVCACLSGVLSLEDALALAVAGRELFAVLQRAPLIGVSISEAELRPLLEPGLGISMVCAPRQCVVGGQAAAVSSLMCKLDRAGIHYVQTPLDLPFHTEFMEPFLGPYRQVLRKVSFHPPIIPYVSCVTGDWIRSEDAMDPEHYLRLAANTVRIDRACATIFRIPDAIFLEVGPSQTMTSFLQLQSGRPVGATVLASQRDQRYTPEDDNSANEPLTLYTAVARLWTLGVEIDWLALYPDKTRQRLPLPTYAFDTQRFWLDPVRSPSTGEPSVPETVGKHPDPTRWFYLPAWRELPPLPKTTPVGTWLVLGSASGLGLRLATQLRAHGVKVVQVEYPTESTQATRWDVLFDQTERAGQPFDQVVYLGLLEPGLSETDSSQLENGFYAFLALGKSLGRRVFTQTVTLNLVGEDLLSLGTAVSAPAKAACLGPLRVLPQEYPNLRCRLIDVQLSAVDWQQARLMDQLIAEFSGPERVVALRLGQRWVERYEPYITPTFSETSLLRAGGVYLITGGLGNIGLTLAERIAKRTPGARLVLTTRGEWPATASSERVRRVQLLEELGAQVKVVRVDVTNESAMGGLVREIERDLGPLRGVVHAAGLVGQESFATAAESTVSFCSAQLMPKLMGSRVLETVLGDRLLDFCILCSSLSPILGGLGFTAYAAANACLDSFVVRHNRTHRSPWICVNWEGWLFDALPTGNQAGAAIAELGLFPDEGADLFEQILALPTMDRIVISTGNLENRIRQWVDMKVNLSLEETNHPRHTRPELLGPFEPPSGGVEIEIARLWERLLGIQGIGALDNFFALGGNSLLLTQLLAQIRKSFRMEFSLTSLFERPTIRDIAALIEVTRTALPSIDEEEGREEGVI